MSFRTRNEEKSSSRDKSAADWSTAHQAVAEDFSYRRNDILTPTHEKIAPLYPLPNHKLHRYSADEVPA